jgi:hypothetical protein
MYESILNPLKIQIQLNCILIQFLPHRRTRGLSSTKIKELMLFRDIIAVYFGDNNTHRYTKIRDGVKAGDTTLKRQ